MPEHLDMPSLAADELIGAHNLFWQFTTGGIITRNGTAMVLKCGWNVGAVNRASAGVYTVQGSVFDAVLPVVPVMRFATVSGAVTKNLYVGMTIAVADAINFTFNVFDAAGAAADIDDAGLGELHFLMIGRRVKQTRQNNLGTIRKLSYDMGVTGL